MCVFTKMVVKNKTEFNFNIKEEKKKVKSRVRNHCNVDTWVVIYQAFKQSSSGRLLLEPMKGIPSKYRIKKRGKSHGAGFSTPSESECEAVSSLFLMKKKKMPNRTKHKATPQTKATPSKSPVNKGNSEKKTNATQKASANTMNAKNAPQTKAVTSKSPLKKKNSQIVYVKVQLKYRNVSINV